MGDKLRMLAVVACVVALSGCTSTGDGLPVSSDWVEPGWMALVRQQSEEYQSGQIACYAEYGLTPIRNMAGGVGFVDLPDDASTRALLERAAADCNARIPLPTHQLNKALDDAAYQKVLDLRQCIVAHGYPMPEAPSAEVWKDSDLMYAWNPYSEFNGMGGMGLGAQIKIADADLFALADACPQPGPNFFVRVPTGE